MSKIEGLLFLMVVTVYSFFVQYPNVNQNSRFDLILALAQQASVSIDAYHENTIDKSFYAGHYYSDKAPGLSLLGLPAYLLLCLLQPVEQPGVWLGYPMHVVNALATALPSALLVLLLLRWLRKVTGHEQWSLAVAGVFALGTLALPFATMFFGHMTAAFFAFAAFYCLWSARSAPRGETTLVGGPLPSLLFLAGLSAGLAFLVEYPAALIAALLGLYALVMLPHRKRVIFYLAGMLPPTLVLLAYNSVAFGGPFQLSYWYSVATPVAGQMRQGLLGAGLPTASGLWQITFGPRGLFTLSPVLLLALPGLWTMHRRPDTRPESWLFLCIALAFVVASAGYFVPTGGGGPGPRFVILALPFLASSVGLAVARWRLPFAVLAPVSVAIMLVATVCNPQAPVSVGNPLMDFWLPALMRREVVITTAYLRFGLRSAASLLMLAPLLLAVLVAWLISVNTGGDSHHAIGRPSTFLGSHCTLALRLCVAVALLSYVVLGFPIDVRSPLTVPQVVMGVTP